MPYQFSVADVNARAAERSGRTALQAAAEMGHLEVVERLLTAKADVNAGENGRTALMAATEKGHLEVLPTAKGTQYVHSHQIRATMISHSSKRSFPLN